MIIALSVLVFLITAVSMEFVAWALHKYVMHGFLWVLHEDHHRPKGRGLQKNDAFALFFAVVSFLLILDGLFVQRWYPLAGVGFGMALYGLGYLLFHDVMFHRRIPGLRIPPSRRYLQRIVNAHKVHHRHAEREGATSFNFLWAPAKYDPS